MATRTWIGTATAVAQVDSVTVTAYDAATTYILTIGGDEVSVIGDTDVATTATNLAAAVDASTHPYFSPLSASANAGVITITGPADGMPFTVTSSVSAGTGTIGAVSTTTSAVSPHHWDHADNWAEGVVPASSDDVYIGNTANSILWGLDQSTVTLTSLRIYKTFTGLIGHNYRKVSTSAVGTTTTSAKTEYRDVKLKISSYAVEVGENNSTGSPSGSGRINLDLGSPTGTVIRIFDTASSSVDTGKSCVRIECNDSVGTYIVYRAPGGLGIGTDEPGETSVVGNFFIADTGTNTTKVNIGRGTTVSFFEQLGGSNKIVSDGTIAAINMKGGILSTYGLLTITAFNSYGGTVYLTNDDVGTLNMEGGTIDTSEVTAAGSTISILNLGPGTFIHSKLVNLGTVNDPSEQQSTIKITKDV